MHLAHASLFVQKPAAQRSYSPFSFINTIRRPAPAPVFSAAPSSDLKTFVWNKKRAPQVCGEGIFKNRALLRSEEGAFFETEAPAGLRKAYFLKQHPAQVCAGHIFTNRACRRSEEGTFKSKVYVFRSEEEAFFETAASAGLPKAVLQPPAGSKRPKIQGLRTKSK